MPQEIVDLDTLRPKPRLIKLDGKKINLSFMPSGILFDINEKLQQMARYLITEESRKAVEKGGGPAKELFEISLEVCATFCEIQHEEMTYEWFRANVSWQQLEVLAKEIRECMDREFTNLEEQNEDEGEEKKAKARAV